MLNEDHKLSVVHTFSDCSYNIFLRPQLSCIQQQNKYMQAAAFTGIVFSTAGTFRFSQIARTTSHAQCHA